MSNDDAGLLSTGIFRLYGLCGIAIFLLAFAVTAHFWTALTVAAVGGLLGAILINELTPGHTMEDSWIMGRKR